MIEKRPCIYHFFHPLPHQYFGLPTQYFRQVYDSDRLPVDHYSISVAVVYSILAEGVEVFEATTCRASVEVGFLQRYQRTRAPRADVQRR